MLDVQGSFHAIAYSADGQQLAYNRGPLSDDSSDQINLLRLNETGEIEGGRRLLAGSLDERVQAISFNPDGSRVASVGSDASVVVCDTETRQELIRFTTRPFGARQLRWSPDGQRLTCVQHAQEERDHLSWGDQVYCWSWDATSTDTIMPLARRHSNRTLAVAFNSDQTFIASAGIDRRLVYYDAASGREAFVWEHGFPWSAIAFAPDGRSLAALGANDRVFIHPGDGKAARQIHGPRTPQWKLRSVGGSVDSSRLGYSPDGRHVVFYSGDKKRMLVVNVQTGSIVHMLEDPEDRYTRNALYSRSGKRIVGWGLGVVCVWDAESGKILQTVRSKNPHGPREPTTQFTRDLKAKLLRLFNDDFADIPVYSAAIQDAAFAADGNSLFLAVNVQLWNLEPKQDRSCMVAIELEMESLEIKGIFRFPGNLMSIATSTDGRWLACGGNLDVRAAVARGVAEGRGFVHVVDLHSGKVARRLEGGFGLVTSIAFGPNDSRMAFATYDGQVLSQTFEQLPEKTEAP